MYKEHGKSCTDREDYAKLPKWNEAERAVPYAHYWANIISNNIIDSGRKRRQELRMKISQAILTEKKKSGI